MDSKRNISKTVCVCGAIMFWLTGCSGSSSGSAQDIVNDVIQAISIDPVGGTAPLSVNFSADASNLDFTGTITSYQWDFGDSGATSSSASASHTYNTTGNKTVTLTATNSEGTQFTYSDTIYVYSAFNNSAAAAPVPADTIFSDDFEYDIDRSASYGSDTNNPFVLNGQWDAAKAINVTGSHYGYLYTTTQIPGYTGNLPGSNPSGRVLAIESRAGTMCSPSEPICQTDFWLQLGDGLTPNAIPANVWFQFWIYSNRFNDPANQNDQISAYATRSKFIYPCNGTYPCSQGNLKWLYMLGYTTGEPHWDNEDITNLFMTTVEPFNVSIDYQQAESFNQFKLGQTDVSDNIRPHRWTLVKLHYDTSGTQGTYEAWVRQLEDPSWTQVADWVGATDPDLNWPLTNVGGSGGHNKFRMPTTVDDFDSWIYMDDFVMASSENGLPVYPN